MGFFDTLKKGFNSVSHAVGSAVHEVSHIVGHATSSAEHILSKAGHAAGKIAKQVGKDAQKVFDTGINIVDRETKAFSNLISSPMFLPVAGIAAVGGIYLLTKV